jgi:hypothetical protein
MPDASQDAEHALVMDVGRMRVARLVGVLVMATVHGDPPQERPLDRHRAEDGEDELHRDVRLERAVNEQPMVTDRDSQAGQDVESQQEAQVGPVESPAPDDERDCNHAEEGGDDGEEGR